MKSLKMIISCVAVCSLAGACGDAYRNDYSRFERLPSAGWRFGEAVEFMPEHADSLCRGSFVVALRHDNSYPFTDISLEVAVTDGGRERRDTITVALAGEFGQWTGRGIGTSFQVADTLPQMVHASGTAVKVRHIMRADTLVGVNQVGLFFVPVENEL